MADGSINQSMDDILAQIRKIIAEDASSGPSPSSLTGMSTPPPVLAKPAMVVPAAELQMVRAPMAVMLPSTTAPTAAPIDAPSRQSNDVVSLAVPPATIPVLDDLSDLIDDDDGLGPVAGVPPPETVATEITVAPTSVVMTAEPGSLGSDSTPVTLPSAVEALPGTVTVADTLAHDVDASDTPAASEVESVKVPAVTVPSAMPHLEAPSSSLPVGATTSVTTGIVAAVAPSSTDVSVPRAEAIHAPADALLSPSILTTAAPVARGDDAPSRAAMTVAAPVPAAAPPEISPVVTVAAVAASPVPLSTLFANRIEPGTGRGGFIVPSHIGRAPPPPAIDTASAPIAAAPIAPAAGSSALGALAAGLAASGLINAPMVEPVEMAPPAPGQVTRVPEPQAEPAAEPAQATPPQVSTDEIMDAMRPILADWLADTLPRALDGAFREALPRLIADARAAAERKRVS